MRVRGGITKENISRSNSPWSDVSENGMIPPTHTC